MHCCNLRKKYFSDISNRKDIVSSSLKLLFDSLKKLWNSVIVSKRTTTCNDSSSATHEDVMYEEYRDELSDFATIRDQPVKY